MDNEEDLQVQEVELVGIDLSMGDLFVLFFKGWFAFILATLAVGLVLAIPTLLIVLVIAVVA